MGYTRSQIEEYLSKATLLVQSRYGYNMLTVLEPEERVFPFQGITSTFSAPCPHCSRDTLVVSMADLTASAFKELMHCWFANAGLLNSVSENGV